MKRYLVFIISIGILTSSFLSTWIVPSAQVAADVSYACPGDQVQGNVDDGQDIRACYSKPCPAGTRQGNPRSTTPGFPTDATKCYKDCKLSEGNNAFYTGCKEQAAAKPEGKQGDIKVDNGDDYKCPSGLYRGGILPGQDESKCYRCDASGCQDANQPTVHKDQDACINTDQACIDRQRREHEQYMQSIRDAAPSGFNIPGSNDTIDGSRNAQLFCNYYKAPEETRIDTNYLYRACIIGYEVGYGSNNICTQLYLFGANATHKDFPNAHAKRFRAYLNSLDHAKRELLVSQSIAACQDGWSQYKVDYWYCGGNQGCQRALRQDQSRIVDPGAPPTRDASDNSDPNLPTPSGIIFQTGTPTHSCGSVQTAYFACGGGGDEIGTSSFWQILQIILNVLIALVAISAVGGILYGAVKYSSAGDNASQVNDAKNIIKNVIIGLVLFLFMWTIIQYFIPGGIF